MPVADLVLPELPAEEHRLASPERGEVDESFVQVFHLCPAGRDLVDEARELPCETLDLRRRVGELRRRDAAAVAANVSLQLLLALERSNVQAPLLDHLLDERPHLARRSVRLLGCEV